MSYYKMQPAEQINKALADMPKAEEMALIASTYGDDLSGVDCEEIVPNFKTIKVTEANGKQTFVSCPTTKYRLVQHEAAFRPIIEGLTLSGIPGFQFIATATAKKAQLQIYVGGDVGSYDSVRLGIRASNSLDSSSCLSYGIELEHTKRWIELVGYRQVCSNGMKIRVPLDRAEIIKPEIVTKVLSLFKQYAYIRHTKGADSKIEAMQYVVEAISLLRQPVENMIKAGQAFSIDTEDKLKSLIKTHVGKRFQKRVLRHYNADDEGADLWGLYNAMTAAASHDADLKPEARETLISKAAAMLLVETK